eukprot:TRINITY_DN14498_c0_g2_i1.p1 TRINITY_DN14498_c0_g2~~TRINITY_DN14498_c0_g2_i1.p1  ORF type:complete len:221 (-),score=5.09 TRINITY_DN14498_c0_g2_i1:147-809(-)
MPFPYLAVISSEKSAKTERRRRRISPENYHENEVQETRRTVEELRNISHCMTDRHIAALVASESGRKRVSNERKPKSKVLEIRRPYELLRWDSLGELEQLPEVTHGSLRRDRNIAFPEFSFLSSYGITPKPFHATMTEMSPHGRKGLVSQGRKSFFPREKGLRIETSPRTSSEAKDPRVSTTNTHSDALARTMISSRHNLFRPKPSRAYLIGRFTGDTTD